MSMAVDGHEFAPRGLLANTHVQSILTSGPWRRALMRRRGREFLTRTREEIVEAGDGVRLLGYRNRTAHADPKDALVILLHGWEGSADSSYLLGMASALDADGFDTFRLNFRDHGPSHHLNRGIFHSCLLREVLQAVTNLARDYRDGPVFLVGFSLGGNFALRVARNAEQTGLKLKRTIAVSPPVRPASVLESLESGLFIYHRYFERKWQRSLAVKQRAWPGEYDFGPWYKIRGLREKTAYLVEHFGEFPDLQAYLDGYSIEGLYLENLAQSALVITAADDPIIPADEIRRLPRGAMLDIEITARGGHCGFIENWRLDGWLESRIRNELCTVLND